MEPALRLWILVVIIALSVLYIYVSKGGRIFEGFQSGYSDEQLNTFLGQSGYAITSVEYKFLKSMLLNGGKWASTWGETIWTAPTDNIDDKAKQFIIQSGMAFNIYNKWYSIVTNPVNKLTNTNLVKPNSIRDFLKTCRYFIPLKGGGSMKGVDDMLNNDDILNNDDMKSAFKHANIYHNACVTWFLNGNIITTTNTIDPYEEMYRSHKTQILSSGKPTVFSGEYLDTLTNTRIPGQTAIVNEIKNTFRKTIQAFQNEYTPSQIDRAVSAAGYDTPVNGKYKTIFIHILVNGGDSNIPLTTVDTINDLVGFDYVASIYTKWVAYMTDPTNKEYIPSNRLNVAFADIVSNGMKALRARPTDIKPPLPNNLGKSTTATNSRVTACRELNDLQKKYVNMLAVVREQMDDLSGTEVLGGNLKGENMKFQYIYEDKCTDRMTPKGFVRQYDIYESNSCKKLASQDEVLYDTIIPGYEMTNITLFKQAARIEEQLYTINTVISLTACDMSGEFTIDPEVDIGTINVEQIKEKLNELSPYFISSGTLDFVTKYLVGNGILDTALYTSTEILTFVKKNLETGIRPLANDQFGIK